MLGLILSLMAIAIGTPFIAGLIGPKKIGKWAIIYLLFIPIISILGIIGIKVREASGLMKAKNLPPIIFQLQGQVQTVQNGNIAVLENTADGKLYFVPTKRLVPAEDKSFVRKVYSNDNEYQLIPADMKQDSVVKINEPNEWPPMK